jgi:GntR family transcriptional regulator, transcriptional repressor for pyruvate dehydrogenase complex
VTQLDRNLQKRARSMPQMLADDIRMQLISGEMVPGQPLPPEKELLTIYGVSRPTLREAMRILEAESLVETVRGMNGGAVLRAPDPYVVIRQAAVLLQLRGTTFADVYAARAVLEIAAVRSLAERGRRTDVAALREIIEESRSSVDSGADAFGRAAGRFHRTLVHFSGNKTMSFFVDVLGSLTDATYNRKVASLEPGPRQEAIMKALRSWSRLTDLIEKRDADRAQAHWTKHLATVGSNLGTEDRPLAAEVLPESTGFTS